MCKKWKDLTGSEQRDAKLVGSGVAVGLGVALFVLGLVAALEGLNPAGYFVAGPGNPPVAMGLVQPGVDWLSFGSDSFAAVVGLVLVVLGLRQIYKLGRGESTGELPAAAGG